MNKGIKGLRTFAFILFLVEVLAMIAFAILYLVNVFDLQSIVKTEYILFGVFFIVFVDAVFLWLMTARVLKIRQNTDLHAAEVIGNDVQAAYNFAQLGLIVINDDNIVLWTNDLFKERNINIIDTNIYEWKPELSVLAESGADNKSVVQLTESERRYEVKFLSQAGLFIFKDITDLTEIYNNYRDQAPVVGLLAIDNYADVVKTEEDFNDSISKVKNVIFSYAKEFGLLLRRYRNDTYFVLTNYKTLEKMKAEGFSLVNRVRQVGGGDDIPLTLSLGIAHEFPDVVKLNDLAEEALSIAMSRGGDQVVISKYGSDMEFIGGKTEAQENRNRVKVRVLADSLIGLIKASSNVLVMGHTMADMDALGSCLGIKAICERVERDCRVVVDLKRTEHKTRAAITSSFSREELTKLIVNPKDAEQLVNPNTLVIVVDVHIPKMVMAPNLLELATKAVVIDHHRRAEEYIESPVFNHIDPSASSASEIITEFIRFSSINPKIDVKPIYATIMMSGILLDSQSFRAKNVGIRTFEACTILKDYGADNALAYDLLKDDYEEYQVVNDILKTIVTITPGVVYCKGDPDRIYDDATLAKAANTCLSIKSIKAAFVFGKINSKLIKMSARSDGSINVQLLTERLGVGGGGHYTAAAAVFEKMEFDQVSSLLTQTIKSNLNEASNIDEVEEGIPQ